MPAIYRDRLYLSTRELLALLPVSRRTLQRLKARGEGFPAPVQLSTGVWAWRTDEVLRWLNERNGRA